jgi:DNA-binding NtrC family response regulator
LHNGAALVSHVESGQGIGTSEDKSVLANVVSKVIASGRSLDVAMAEIEAAVIRAALKQQRGNRSAAARQLQLPRQTLQDRMKKHGLWSS